MPGRAPASRVDRAGGERRGRAAGAADAAVGGTRRPVVAGRRDHERVERGRSRGRCCERAVGERRERLDDADERDARRVVGVAVLVRVDRELDARRAAGRCGRRRRRRRPRPAASPRRGSAAARRPARRPASPAGRPSRRRGPPSRCRGARAAGCGRVLAGARVAAGIEHVEPPDRAPPDVRVDEVDAGVEQGDRDPGAREARECRHPAAARRATPSEIVDAARVDRGGNRRPHREDALHVGVALDDRERAGVERGREPVEHAVVGVLGLDRRAVERKPREHVALARRGRGRPGALLLLGRDAAGGERRAWRATASRGRRSSARRAGPRAGRRAGSPSPAAPVGLGRRRSPPRRGAAPPRAPRAERGERPPRAGSIRQPTHTHPDSGPRRHGNGIGEPRRRRDHRRVVGAERRAARGRRRAARRGARSSPPRRRRRRSARCPVCSAASRSRCVSASTIARW